MTIPLPFAHRRFEFKILDGEDPDTMVQPDNVAELMRRFYPEGVVPPAVRRRIYLHHSRTAARFQKGRVFLVGDAAHLQPPFFGQGMNSGIRDVTNLAWKLGLVLTGRAGPALLASYDAERRENARDMVEFATGVGRLYHPRGKLSEAVRNFFFRLVQKIPGGRDYILQMKYKPVPRYREGFVWPGGGAGAKASPVGRAFPQPRVQALDGARLLLDDVFGSRLAVLGLVPGVYEALSPATRELVAAQGGVVVQTHVPPAYRRHGQFDPVQRGATGPLDVADIYDLEGGLRDALLARPGDEVLIIRPDRYVAAIASLAGADRMVREVFGAL